MMTINSCGGVASEVQGHNEDDELPCSHSEPPQTYKMSDSVIQNLTYAITTNNTGESSEKTTPHTTTADVGEATEDDVSTSAPNSHGDGGSDVRGASKDADRSDSAEFLTAVEAEECSPEPSSQEDVFSTSTVSSYPEGMVRASACKSPVMQCHIARIMGCKASFIPKKKTQSARVQTRYSVQESSTQSETVQQSQISIQANRETTTAVAQTSSTSVKDAETEYPDKEPQRIPNNKGTPVRSDTTALPRPRKSIYTPPVVAERKLSWTAKPKIGSLENSNHQPGGGTTSIPVRKLQFRKSAIPKVGSITEYRRAGGQVKIQSQPADFKSKAKSKIGSLENVSYKSKGGDIKIYQAKLTFNQTATSKVGSMVNISHKPGGGNRKIFYQVVPRRPSIQSVATSPHDKLSKQPRKERSLSPRSTASDFSEMGYSMVTEPVRCSSYKTNLRRSFFNPKAQSVYF